MVKKNRVEGDNDKGRESQGGIIKKITESASVLKEFTVERWGDKLTAIIPHRKIARIRKLIEDLDLKELEKLAIFVRDKIKEKKQE